MTKACTDKGSHFQFDTEHGLAGVVKYAVPIFIASVLQQFYNTADLLILSVFDSQNAMATIGSCSFLTGLIVTFAVGLSTGISVNVSTALGQDKNCHIRPLAQNGIIINGLIGIIMSALTYFSGPFLLSHLICVPVELSPMADLYLKIYAIGIIFQFLYNYFTAMLLGHGDSKSSLLFLLLSTIVNIFLDFITVYFFNLSVAGVAWSTVISQLISFVFVIAYTHRKYDNIFFHIQTKKWYISIKSIYGILRVGIPLSFQGIVINSGYMLIQKIVNSFGSDMTASYSVASRLEMYMLIPFISFTSALAIYTGYLIGNHKYEIFKKILKQVRFAYVILALIIGCIAFLKANFFADLFNLNVNASKIFISHFKVIAFDIIIYSLYSPINSYLMGTKRTYYMLMCSCTEMFGRIVMINILSHMIGLDCVRFSEPIPWIFVCIMMNILNARLMKSDKI